MENMIYLLCLVCFYGILHFTLFIHHIVNILKSNKSINKTNMPPKRKLSTNDNDHDNSNDHDQQRQRRQQQKMEELLCSLTNKNEERFDSLTKECECLRRENREILSAIEEMKMKIGDVHEVVNPAPIWKLITDHPDIFEKHVLKSGYLNGSDLKFFYGTNTDTRLAIKRAKIELQKKFKIEEMSSISQLKFAWDNYHWGEEWEGTQRYFCERVARMNKLEYLVWAQEVKRCDWGEGTIDRAVEQGNLAMVKYCVENECPMHTNLCALAARVGHLDVLKYFHEIMNCPWSSRACYFAHLNNHVECLNYLIEQKCPGFERYLPPLPAAQ